MTRRGLETEDFESIKMRFIEAWEAGECPTLEQYVGQYPGVARELTEFVVAFAEIEAATAQAPEVSEPSAAEREAVRRAVEGVCGPAASLTEVRQSLGWAAARLARELNLPRMAVIWMERGLLHAYPDALRVRLREILGRPIQQIDWLLQRPSQGLVAPAHSRSTGTPQPIPAKHRTFREALLELERKGQLTPAQRREWLPEEQHGSVDVDPQSRE